MLMMTNCEAAVNDFTIRKSVAHVDEDGTMGATVIDVRFNSETMMFSAELPPYVAAMPSIRCLQPIVDDTAKGVIETYEVCCDEYSQWKAGTNLSTRLWIGTYVNAGDFARSAFGFTNAVGIGVTQVKVLPNGQMIAVLEDGSLGGHVGSKGSVCQPIIVDDTPEHREKVQRLANSIQRAADILNGLNLAANPAEYLMAISDDWTQRRVPEQVELDLEPVVDEDDEL